jgi:hypothetical protein
VSSAKEFRENADECFAWARTAKTDKERQIFLQMARAWLEVAERREGVSQTARWAAAEANAVGPTRTVTS